MNPVVSVILPTYNRASALRVSAASVLAQTFTDLELIIIDDGSEEDIASVADSFKDDRVRYVRREINGGVAAARNTGIAIANGKYVAFQDSDDEWLLNKLDSQLRSISGLNGKCQLSICALLRSGRRSFRVYPSGFPRASVELNLESVAARPDGYVQTWLVEKSLLLSSGLFDENLAVREDWEMLMRLSRMTAIIFVPEILVVSSILNDGLNQAPAYRCADSYRRILETHAASLSSFPRAMQMLRLSYARNLVLSGQLEEARDQSIRALRLNPYSVRAWKLVFSTFLPLSLLVILQKKWRFRS